MVGWHHLLDGHEFEQAPGVGDGQGRLVCSSPWGCKNWTWLSNLTELNWKANKSFEKRTHWSQQTSFSNNTGDDSMDITRLSLPKSDCLYSLQLKRKNSIQSGKKWPGADCDSDHQLLIAKLKLKLKKLWKTTRPFRYDLNQIPYDYSMEVMNRFKGLGLVHRVPEELWMKFHNTGGSEQNHPKEKEMQEGSGIVWGGFSNSWGKKRNKRKGRKGKIYPIACRESSTEEQGEIRRPS